MIETGAFPGEVRVTRAAVGRESCGHVIRVLSGAEVLGMAIKASGSGATKLATYMAGSTADRRVGSAQREAGELIVIEFRFSPGVHRVAVFTSLG